MAKLILSANRYTSQGESGFVLRRNLVNYREPACSELIEQFGSSVVAVRNTAGQFFLFRRVCSLKQRIASL